MANVGTAYVSIVPEVRQFGKQLSTQVGGESVKAGKASGRAMGGGMLSGAAGPLAGLTGMISGPLMGAMAGLVTVKAFAGFVNDARESARVGRLTAQVIKSTGGAAKITASQVGDLATAISNKTGMDDEAIQSGANLLLTFKNVRNEAGRGNDIFNQATQAAADLSAAGFGDLNGASKQLGKALNDPVKGMTALSRSGVTFSAAQQKQIKSMVAHNKTLDAQKLILGEVQSQVGGAAAAAADPMQKLQVVLGNVGESIGGALLPAVDGFANFTMKTLIPAGQKLVGLFQQNVLPVLQRIGGMVQVELTPYFRAWSAMVSGVVLPTFKSVGGFITRTVLPALARFQQSTILPFLQRLSAFLTGTVTPALQRFGQTQIVPFLQRVGAFISGTIVPALVRFGGYIQTTIIPALQRFTQTQVVPFLQRVGTFIGTVIVPALVRFGQIVVTQVLPAVLRFGQFLVTALAPAFVSIGTFITQHVVPALGLLGQFVMTRIFPALQGLWVRFVQVLPTIVTFAGFLGKVIGVVLAVAAVLIGKLVPVIMTVAGFILSKLIPVIINVAGPIFTLLFAAIGKVIGIVAALIRIFISIVTTTVKVAVAIGRFVAGAVGAFVRFHAGVQAKVTQVVMFVKALPARIINALAGLALKLYNFATGAFKRLHDGATSAAKGLFDFVKGLPRRVVSGFGNIGSSLLGVGKDLIGGLVQGIRNTAGDITRALIDVLPEPLRKFAGKLGIHSPSTVFATFGRYVVEGFTKGIRDSASKATAAVDHLSVLASRIARENGGPALRRQITGSNKQLEGLVTRRNDIVRRLADANKVLKATPELAGQVSGNVLQGVDITGMGGEAGAVQQRLADAVANTRAFQHNLDILRKRGLNKSALSQIINAGVDQGGATAEGLARASAGQLAAVNKLQSQLGSAATATGRSAAEAMYGAGANAAKGLVKGLTAQQKAIEAQMLKIANGMKGAIKKALGIKSPSTVMAALGADVAAGFANGINGGVGRVGTAAGRLAGAATVAATVPRAVIPGTAPAPVGAGNGSNVTVYADVRETADITMLINRLEYAQRAGSFA